MGEPKLGEALTPLWKQVVVQILPTDLGPDTWNTRQGPGPPSVQGQRQPWPRRSLFTSQMNT